MMLSPATVDGVHGYVLKIEQVFSNIGAMRLKSTNAGLHRNLESQQPVAMHGAFHRDHLSENWLKHRAKGRHCTRGELAAAVSLTQRRGMVCKLLRQNAWVLVSVWLLCHVEQDA